MRKDIFHSVLTGAKTPSAELLDMEILVERYPYSDVVWAAYVRF